MNLMAIKYCYSLYSPLILKHFRVKIGIQGWLFSFIVQLYVGQQPWRQEH